MWLAEILYGLITGNYKRVAEIHFEAGYVPAHHNVAEFATALRAVGEPMRGMAVKDMSIGMMLDGLFNITRDFDMQTQPHLLLLQKTMVMVEGVATSLDPEINLWDAAAPFVREWIRTELGARGGGGGPAGRGFPHACPPARADPQHRTAFSRCPRRTARAAAPRYRGGADRRGVALWRGGGAGVLGRRWRLDGYCGGENPIFVSLQPFPSEGRGPVVGVSSARAAPERLLWRDWAPASAWEGWADRVREMTSLWLATPTRFAMLKPQSARLGLAALALLLLATLLALASPGPPPVSHDPAARGDDHADVVLYETIVLGMRGGGDYYSVTAQALRSGKYPMRPFVTFRLPTLALVQAALPPPVTLALLYALIAGVLLAWYRRLAPVFLRAPPRLVAIALLCGGLTASVQSEFVSFHEVWAGLLIALSLALRREDKWVEAVAIGLIAMLIRENRRSVCRRDGRARLGPRVSGARRSAGSGHWRSSGWSSRCTRMPWTRSSGRPIRSRRAGPDCSASASS